MRPPPAAGGGRRPRVGLTLTVVMLLLLGGREAVAEPFHVPSASMAPTVMAGDHVLVAKLPAARTGFERGDLVVFRAPDSGDVVLKRVVALPGDTVGIADGRLVVNEQAVEEPYADQEEIDGVYFGPVRVGPESFFALGDDRLDSEDSRDFGPVPESSVIGPVAARIWPPSRWGTP